MTTCDLKNPIFSDEDKARETLEAVRWPSGPVCPHCGSAEGLAKVEGKKRSHRPGLFYCNACKGQFTATVGTLFERSKIPLTKWWLAVYMLASSKKGISTHQLHRSLGVTYKTAWFMTHRIREAMRSGELAPMGGAGGSGKVEADETYFGKYDEPRERLKKRYYPVTKGGRSGPANKRAVLALVERGGKARLFHVITPDKITVEKIVRDNIAKEAVLYTDESRLYLGSDEHFLGHETVTHSHKEYVRGDVHTNTVEGAFSIFKRGMKGVYQHCAEKHLHRYLAEFEFRYNTRTALGVNDAQRAMRVMAGIEGKRLTYRRTDASLV
jgi:transposase-like protein